MGGVLSGLVVVAEAVKEIGNQKWKEVAMRLRDHNVEKTPKQCRERMLEQLDPSDPQVMYRKNKILQKYAIKIQTVFRGWKARKQLMSRSVRVVARNYGCRAPLKNRSKDVVQRMGTYTQSFTVSERGR